MTFADGPTLRVAAGQAGFMGAQQVHAHLNGEDVVPAAIIAILIVVAGVIVVLAATRRPHVRSGLILAGLIALVVLGGLAVWNPWSNDWLFISIRPAAARGGPMPLPSASRLYESTDLAAMPPGPYVETVQEVTIAPGSSFDFESHGASLLLVIDGQAQVQPSDSGSLTLAVHQAVLLQHGVTAQVAASSNGSVRLLEFTVAPVG
jgi:quercetin dioxygenase-like cupin family protein